MPKYNFTLLNDSYYILLTLYNCALLLSIGAGGWEYPKVTAFIICMIGLQFLSRKFWFTTFLSCIPYYFIYAPIFPRSTNHGNLQVFIGILFVLFVILKFRKIKENRLDHKMIANIFIYSLITIYFVSGFHKLNAGFFDLTSSCTNYVSSNFNSFLFGESYRLPPMAVRTSQILTILFEMVIPFGLLFHNTRRITTWLLIAFHFFMSLYGFSNFSAFAGFLICGCIINFDHQKPYYQSIIRGLRYYIFFCILSVLISFAVSRLGLFDKTHLRVYNGIIFNMGWLVFFAILLKKSTFIKEQQSLKIIPIIFVIFIVMWGGQAYVGLSNAGNLTMFSNLLTEKSRSNHYWIDTKRTKIWSFEEDIVTIVDIADSLKWENAEPLKSFQLPLIEFKTQADQWVRKHDRPIEIIIRYQDKLHHIPDLKLSEFSKVKWWYRYIQFRKLPKPGTNDCLW